MTLKATASPGCGYPRVFDDALRLARRTGAIVEFPFNDDTVEVFPFSESDPSGGLALVYKSDQTLKARYVLDRESGKWTEQQTDETATARR